MKLVKRCLKKKGEKPAVDSTHENATPEDKPKLLCLPYVKGLSEKIERSCRKVTSDLKMVFKSQRTLRSLLSSMKNRTPAEKVKRVVYKVNCSCGSTYVGEIGRTLEIRLKEHQRVVKSRQTNNGIPVHANSTQHNIQWARGNAEVIC